MQRIIFLYALCLTSLWLCGCQTLEPKQEEPPVNKYLYLRTSELIRTHASLVARTDAYLEKQGKKGLSKNRRKLGTLADEVSREQVKERRAIEAELIKRFKSGDKEAKFKGMEALLESNE